MTRKYSCVLNPGVKCCIHRNACSQRPEMPLSARVFGNHVRGRAQTRRTDPDRTTVHPTTPSLKPSSHPQTRSPNPQTEDPTPGPWSALRTIRLFRFVVLGGDGVATVAAVWHNQSFSAALAPPSPPRTAPPGRFRPDPPALAPLLAGPSLPCEGGASGARFSFALFFEARTCETNKRS